jgi:hypothetical protein
MTSSSSLLLTSRERFLEAAQAEFAAFERKERAFRAKLQNERAEELHLPIDVAIPRPSLVA